MEMYSDSMHDKPLLDLAVKSYMVVKDNIYDYELYKPNIFKRFWNFCWGYIIKRRSMELSNSRFLTTLVSISSYAFSL